MGAVFTDITVANRADEHLVRTGHLAEKDVRRFTLAGVLVDTGATTLALPLGVIQELGLTVRERVTVSTAAGMREAGIYGDVGLTVMGRTDVFSCIALPEDTEPLLGVIPLEMLGLEPDLVNRRLRLLPRHGRRTHILAY